MLSALFITDLMKKYFCPDMCVDPEIDVGVGHGIPTFYYTFYVYQ